MKLPDPLLEDLHKCLQAFPEVVQIPEACEKHSPLPHDSACSDAEPHSITIDFRIGFCCFDLSRFVGRKGWAFFFFLPDIFVSHLTICSTSGRPNLPRLPRILFSLAQMDVCMQTPFMTVTTLNLLPRLVPRTSLSWSIRACFILFKISSRSLSKFKFFVLRLCIICQSFFIVTCGRPRSLSQ